MMYRVEISRQAESDLREIYEYIAFSLLEPDNAGRQLKRLEQQILNLEYFPERFRLYEKEPWHSRGVRLLPVDNFAVFYLVHSEKKLVTVIRVMYGGRDVEKELPVSFLLSEKGSYMAL